jgi:hypothetical protein
LIRGVAGLLFGFPGLAVWSVVEGLPQSLGRSAVSGGRLDAAMDEDEEIEPTY